MAAIDVHACPNGKCHPPHSDGSNTEERREGAGALVAYNIRRIVLGARLIVEPLGEINDSVPLEKNG